MRHVIAATSIALAGAAGAQDLALVIGNEDYQDLPEVVAGDDTATLVERLDAEGFEVIARSNASHRAIREAVAAFADGADGADRLVVVLLGHFLHTDRDTFLLPIGREEPRLADLARRALPVSTLSTVLDDLPAESAIMVLGGSGWSGPSSPFVARGIADPSAEAGHVVVAGPADAAGDFARDVVAVPGAPIEPRALGERGLSVAGLAEPPMVLLSGEGAREAERDYWQAIRTFDTERAYANYLERFPDGLYAAEARERLDAIRRDPERQARLAEDALDLAQVDRLRVQNALSVLGYDPRGIDGVFGGATRAALRSWQASQGLPETGYLSADQLTRLGAQAGRRTAEIEARAEQEREAALRRDEAYWVEVGEGRNPEGLQAYLDRYPEGLFADRARARLEEEEGRRSAALADAEAWEEARERDRPGAYRRYIEAFPEGAHVEEARARAVELRGERVDEAAVAGEEALGLSAVTRSLAENRLEALGFEPGAVDGRFDAETRRAVRRYQRSRGLEPTGYLDRSVVAQLLADTILR